MRKMVAAMYITCAKIEYHVMIWVFALIQIYSILPRLIVVVKCSRSKSKFMACPAAIAFILSRQML
jgi:hypothetical protein